jgi:hypothetical protein
LSFTWGTESKGDDSIRTLPEIVKDAISKDDKEEEGND